MTTLLYRNLLREFSRSTPPGERNGQIFAHLRTLFASASHSKEDMESMVDFLRASRQHKELLKRYNPLSDQTPQERVEATARRVGLAVPQTPDF
ncbi:hypothetical protein E3P92_04007 [Wallemia ichthyophaga]|uniref:Complex 1 LYR protein n=2 Tax=Wallemia ichthyophaga TaxID=245174 RepID=A0A4V6TMJ6_WALIC|nr:uncharacterized protein J056_000514 [Wallemia ichthyophaga EXF-994]TIA68473.1 hypothetical protein E3P91_04058 [Wallemia ichthyophaga]EOR00704.1 hypothetical protein J056_000514 [Wallemia ichthyophaga EXF-994]TIA78011.1 hypothetical protein E3P98_04013 [Wallemia ichthyophaga]TIA87170.1 hypothetical protein E3P97_04046 [Wallemia ichthyophaga]TIA94831.1 hypothetical protein E3P95_04042 [Wallemia ichthyophaga]